MDLLPRCSKLHGWATKVLYHQLVTNFASGVSLGDCMPRTLRRAAGYTFTDVHQSCTDSVTLHNGQAVQLQTCSKLHNASGY